MATSRRSQKDKDAGQTMLIFSSEELPAKHSASPDSERDWMTRVVTWPLSSWRLLTDCGPGGWSGRMFPDCSVPTGDATLQGCSWKWTGSGIMEHGECLMLNGSEWPSADEGSSACSLASILEPSVAPKYFLSKKACAGILRRAEKRGKQLPELLAKALQEVAIGMETTRTQA